MERESMEFDVVIVGAGPAGLSSACRIMQLAEQQNLTLSVCVVEKGSEVGAHILSGAVFETRALEELFPDWKTESAPLNTEVTRDDIFFLKDEDSFQKIPGALVPKTMHNQGNYITSMGNMCRWLAEKAESLGVEVFPGFPASEVIYDDTGKVVGVITGDMGLDANGEQKDSFMAGMELRAKYTIFAEGCRGHLGKQLISKFALNEASDEQHYAIGFKEIWDIDPDLHEPGLVVHTAGWPLTNTNGGGFLYHAENNQVFVGLIVDLNYDNPYLSPFDEFQRMKHHPVYAKYLVNGKRVSYGARAITKGGLNAIPDMAFPGGIIIGCNAGTLNFAKIKGNHTAMKSGILAADAIVNAIAKNQSEDFIADFKKRFKESWLYKELESAANFGPAIHKFGTFIGGAYNVLEQNIFGGKRLFKLTDNKIDYAQLKKAELVTPISYPKPDGKLSFDKLSSVFLSNTNHEEDQPCHLVLKDADIPLTINLPLYAEPAQRYCPAGVYEIIEENGEKRFQINSQNCIHCKTCDIKDPSQNITWVTPEGTGGPNYPNM